MVNKFWLVWFSKTESHSLGRSWVSAPSLLLHFISLLHRAPEDFQADLNMLHSPSDVWPVSISQTFWLLCIIGDYWISQLNMRRNGFEYILIYYIYKVLIYYFLLIFIEQRLCELLWTTEIWERKENSDRPNWIGFAEEWNGMSFHKYNLNSNHLYFLHILQTLHLLWLVTACMCMHACTYIHTHHASCFISLEIC